MEKCDTEELVRQFVSCRQVLNALGDETRQHIILEMMKIQNCHGLRVQEIARITNLSRTAVWHHLQILMDAGILCVRHEGTRNYYYFDADEQMLENLSQLTDTVRDLMAELQVRRQERKKE